MGFSNLDSYQGSDNADALRTRILSMTDRPGTAFFTDVLNAESNAYNTPGYIDVALLLEDGCITPAQVGQENMVRIIRSLIDDLAHEPDDELLEPLSRMLKFLAGLAKF